MGGRLDRPKTNSPRTPEQIAARHDAIFGHPPRIEPVRELTDEQRELMGPPPGFEKYVGRSPAKASSTAGALVNLIMAHNRKRSFPCT